MQDTQNTAKAVGFVMVIMILSRMLSLVSTIIYTTFYGNTLEMNIYSYAIQFPNIVFTIFGTALATVVIPIFGGYIGKGERERAFKFADNITSLSLVFTGLLAFLGVLAAPVFPLLTDFTHKGYGFAVAALRIMFPVMVFYALNYVLQGILQSLGRFNMPAFVSVPSSLAVIIYVFAFGHTYGVKGLLIATFIGLSLQALVLIPPAFKAGYRYHPSFDYRDEDIKRAVKLMLPVMAGTSAYQLNLFFNVTMTARFENAVTIMALVQNLILYSILALIYSITAVVFPRFTVLAARNDMEGLKNSLLKVLRSVMYFLVPATASFVAVRSQLLNFLISWGRMTPGDVFFASRVLALYALGITGIGIKEVVDRVFYSLNDTKKPAVNGIIIMLVNISASLFLIRFIGVLGIPLANSVSALSGAFVILYLLKGKIDGFGGRNLLNFTLKVVAASIVMLAAVQVLNSALGRYTFGFDFIDKGVKLLVPAIAGAAIYFFSTYLLKIDEAIYSLNKMREMLKRVRKREIGCA